VSNDGARPVSGAPSPLLTPSPSLPRQALSRQAFLIQIDYKILAKPFIEHLDFVHSPPRRRGLVYSASKLIKLCQQGCHGVVALFNLELCDIQ